MRLPLGRKLGMAAGMIVVAAYVGAAEPSSPGLIVAIEGAAAHRILIAPRPPRSVQLASEELKEFIQKATGIDLAVTSDSKIGPFISLGDTAAARAAGLTAEGMAPEGFRIAAKEGSVFILGPDTADGATTPTGGVSTGTLNGVYAFLEEQVGVRWLMPGPEGEDVPKLSSLAIPADLDRTGAPAFQSRRLPYAGSGPRVEQWMRRLRIGGSLRIVHHHNWQATVPETLFAEHPDWFAEFNGVRVPPVGRYKLETTNPQLVAYFAAKAIESFRKNPGSYCFSLSPSDSAGWSQSKESRALYETDPQGKVSVTRLVLTFYNEVARIVGKEFPDRVLGGYVYSQYLYPPQGDNGGRIEPNLFLVCAPSPDYGYTLYRLEVRQVFDEVLGGWARRTDRLGYYDLPTNLTRPGGVPIATGIDILRFIFPRVHKYGVKHVYIYGNSAWGTDSLGNYLKAKLMWDPEADVRAMARDYLDRAYGAKAGPIMAELHDALDEATSRHYLNDRRASYTFTPEVLKGVYAESYPRLESLFLKAKAAAVEPAQAARLALYERGMVLLNWNLRRADLLPNAERSPLYRSDAEVEKLLRDRTFARQIDDSGDAAGSEPLVRFRLADPAPPPPAGAPPMTPYRIRHDSRLLLHVDQDEEVRVTFEDVPKTAQVIRYKVRDSLGRAIADGDAGRETAVTFAGQQGQTYVMDVTAGRAAYGLKVAGARYAVQSAGREKHGITLLGRTTPLYLYVPGGTAAKAVAITMSSASPGETAAADVVSPSGRVVGSLDTSNQPAMQLVLPAVEGSSTLEEGFWTIRFKRPSRGVVDDVLIDVTGPAGRWFGVDPGRLLAVLPQK